MSPNRPPNDNEARVKQAWKHHSQFERNEGLKVRESLRALAFPARQHAPVALLICLEHPAVHRERLPCIPQHAASRRCCALEHRLVSSPRVTLRIS